MFYNYLIKFEYLFVDVDDSILRGGFAMEWYQMDA